MFHFLAFMFGKDELIALADKYETKDFLKKDPSRFMHDFLPENGGNIVDTEVIAFICANLAFGRREQILLSIKKILKMIDDDKKNPSQWIIDENYKRYFDCTSQSFYRMYTCCDMRIFFDFIRKFLVEKGSLGEYFRDRWNKDSNNTYLHQTIAESFTKPCSLISQSKNGAAKKLNMFLRWMVRDNSPVDLGLWKWYDKSKLLLPLDTHVMQQSVKFGFLNCTSTGNIPGTNLKTCIKLTEKMNEYFKGDPCRADFALFGLGVDKKDKAVEKSGL